LFMTAVAICSFAGSIVSGAIMQAFDGAIGLAGWQWLFLIEALPALGIGVYFLLRLTDNIQVATWLQPDEKALLAAQLSADDAHTPAGTFKTAFRDWRVWIACLIYFSCTSGIYGLGFWLPTIVADMGVKSTLEIGMLTAIPYAVAAVGMVLVGRSSDKHLERRWHFAVSAALGGLGLVLSVQFSNYPAAALAALTLATFGVMSASPLFWSFPTAFLKGAAAAAGIATLKVLRDDPPYEKLEALSARLEQGLHRAAKEADVPHAITRVGSMLTFFFHSAPPADWDAASQCDTAAYAKYFWGLLDRGTYMPCSQFESLFVSSAHSEADVDATALAAQEAFAEL